MQLTIYPVSAALPLMRGYVALSFVMVIYLTMNNDDYLMKGIFNFAHFIPISTVDWYGRSVSVVFFRGCQLRCLYCQNHAYLTGWHEINIDDITSRIVKALPFISAVVFSGGEPTLQPDALKALCRFVTSKSLAVGLETNGFACDVIGDMLDEGILDKVMLDIKAPPDNPLQYSRITGLERITGTQAAQCVDKTLDRCLRSGIELEVRTTVFRHLIGAKEVSQISRYLHDKKAWNLTYVIQQGRPENTLHLKDTEIFNRHELLAMVKVIESKNLKDIRIRTIEYGDERIG
jgi:pyruvate formate lyase activating enzyme